MLQPQLQDLLRFILCKRILRDKMLSTSIAGYVAPESERSAINELITLFNGAQQREALMPSGGSGGGPEEPGRLSGRPFWSTTERAQRSFATRASILEAPA
jgi:hypothetical protein